MASTVDADRIREVQESDRTQHKKIAKLARWLRESKYTVFFTGAGISTSAGIGDYRGPKGAWTMRRIRELERQKLRGSIGVREARELEKLLAEAERKGQQKSVPMIDAQPTSAHMAIATLVRRNMARFVVTTNLDGIHRKSGLKAHEEVCNLHGCVYAERCTGCGYDFERNYNTRRRNIHVHDHHIGICSRCSSRAPRSYSGIPASRNTGAESEGFVENRLVGTQDKNVGTKDTHINFGELLDDKDWKEADFHCRKADVVVVAGTSMSLRHITHFPFLAKKTVIINLQQTPDDSRCHLRIWGKTDPIFEALMEQLSIPIDPSPIWRPRDSLPIEQIPRYVGSYYLQAAKRLEELAVLKEAEVEERKKEKERERKMLEERERKIQMIQMREARGRVAALVRSGIRIGNDAACIRPGLYRWTMFVEAAESKINLADFVEEFVESAETKMNLADFVEKVVYSLHTTFTPSSVAVSSSESRFGLTRVGWGTFTVKATLHWKKQHEQLIQPLVLTHRLNFSPAGGSSVFRGAAAEAGGSVTMHRYSEEQHHVQQQQQQQQQRLESPHSSGASSVAPMVGCCG
eukprot:CAMPEP_0197515390 /NCGR_PEP_ID=MMETSP1318-20131121/539_1 /TAXON_ID=552666 /ORGANISM="Partenskyella glossopodia, Strain RCC365" /LENGTH=576 /DNA_ID=CAMNT_0043063753 /DNA_START=74 /DNA_END=1804 /DNA_ORIENTATION=-